MAQKKSFWSTIPGFVTGAATVITAVLGVLGVIQANKGSPMATNDSATPSATNSSPSPTSASGRGTSGSGGSSDARGQARVSPRTLDFGRAAIGRTSEEMTVTVTNIGDGELTIDGVDVNGANASLFRITSNRCAPGQTVQPEYDCEIALTFAPNAAGDFRATLTIDHDGLDSPSEVALSGTGALLPL
ncbi:MAG: choice-of-anchor D domain-containing protein [Actinomycetota bacterium]|nr:choice-of-anchor D domain-containing protein [Actinomycetota bacterium]